MAITNKTRKILWAKSGNRCAICENELVMKVEGNNTVIGEECHIISPKKNGPRHKSLDEYDNYDNLILLCSVHHKVIDDNEKTYTIEKIKNIKKRHEYRCNSVHILNDIEIRFFHKINYTRDLVRCIKDSEQVAIDYPIECTNDYELFDEFFDMVHNNDVFDLDNEFYMIKCFDDIVGRIQKSGYVILVANEDSYGPTNLKTSFVFIKSLDEYEKGKVILS